MMERRLNGGAAQTAGMAKRAAGAAGMKTRHPNGRDDRAAPERQGGLDGIKPPERSGQQGGLDAISHLNGRGSARRQQKSGQGVRKYRRYAAPSWSIAVRPGSESAG